MALALLARFSFPPIQCLHLCSCHSAYSLLSSVLCSQKCGFQICIIGTDPTPDPKTPAPKESSTPTGASSQAHPQSRPPPASVLHLHPCLMAKSELSSFCPQRPAAPPLGLQPSSPVTASVCLHSQQDPRLGSGSILSSWIWQPPPSL